MTATTTLQREVVQRSFTRPRLSFSDPIRFTLVPLMRVSNMTNVTEEQVLDALRTVKDGERGDVVTLGMVDGVQVREGHVLATIAVAPQDGEAKEPLRKACEQAIDALSGVLSVTAVLTAHASPSAAATPAANPPHAAPPGPGAAPGPQAQPAAKPELPGVRALVAVASGKGGVGKSTTAVNLALGLKAQGLRVGLMDSDIYGPSVPRMLGIAGQPNSPDGQKIEPMRAHGIPCMSIGFMVAEDTPIIWRGPMVMSAVEQMLRDVLWGELDVLVIDLPPGTGDAQLTLAQRVPLTGAVIVSTPQDIALLDVRRGIGMFEKVHVPVFGIIENMSYFICPHCGERSDIFSHGGARETAERLGTEFLGEIPLNMAIRETSDAGTPIVVSQPNSPHAKTYLAIAARIHEKIEEALGEGARAAPNIVIQ